MLQAQWLKITEKVSFINVSKASYTYYIMSGQKFIKSAKKMSIENLKLKESSATFWVIFKPV